MIASDVLRLVDDGRVSARAIVSGGLVFWMIPLAAFLEGIGRILLPGVAVGSLAFRRARPISSRRQ